MIAYTHLITFHYCMHCSRS